MKSADQDMSIYGIRAYSRLQSRSTQESRLHLIKKAILIAGLLSQPCAIAQATEAYKTYLFENNPGSNRSGPVDAATQLAYYAANLVLVQKCDGQHQRHHEAWENRIAVGILTYGSRYRLSYDLQKASERDAQKQLNDLNQHGKISDAMCRHAASMFRAALAADMEPPNGTKASDEAESKNRALAERLKAGFFGSIRSGRAISPFQIANVSLGDYNTFEATMKWPRSGTTNIIRGRVNGKEQLIWREISSQSSGKSVACEYTLNRRSPTSMAGIWGKCARGGFVEISLPDISR